MRIDQHSCAQLPRQSNHVAARESRTRDIGTLDGNAATRLRDLDIVLVGLEAANARPEALRQYLDLLPGCKTPIEQSSGDNSTKACQTEDAVNGQTRTSNVLSLLRFVEHLLQVHKQFLQALTGIGGDG